MSKLGKNVTYQAVYHVLAVCIPLVTAPYLSRVLGADGLGIYSYNYSVISYFMLFAQLGVSTYGLRTISLSKDKEEISKNFFGIYCFQLITTTVALLAYVAFVALFVKNPTNRTASIVQLLYLLGEGLSINWLFFGLEKNKSIVIRNTAIKLFTVISIFAFVRVRNDVFAYIFILALSHFLSNLVMWFQVKGQVVKTRICWADIAKHIKPNIILFIPVLAASVYHIMDKTMLGVFSDSSNVGYYYNADKLLNIPLTVVTGCSAVFMSRACAQSREKDKKNLQKTRNESIYFGMCVISAVAFGVCAVANEFVPLFFGEGYEPCVDLVKYFAAIIIIKTISTHTRSVFLIPENNDTAYAKAIAIGGLINLVVNYVLMAMLEMGALGATIGTLIAEALVALLQIIMMKEKTVRRACVQGIMRSFVYIFIGIIMLLVIVVLPLGSLDIYMRLTLKILIGASIYLICCMLVWWVWPSLMPDIIKEPLRSARRKLFHRSGI